MGGEAEEGGEGGVGFDFGAGAVGGDADADGQEVEEGLEFGDALLEDGVEAADLGLGVFALGDFVAELGVDRGEISGAGGCCGGPWTHGRGESVAGAPGRATRRR